MTVPTTNYGWIKPSSTESADVRVLNTLMDDMDADMKSVSDTLQSKVYSAGQYSLSRKVALAGDSSMAPLTSLSAALWNTDWAVTGNAGSWTFTDFGVLTFTSPGIYKMTLVMTTASVVGGTITDGLVGVGLTTNSGGVQVPRCKVVARANTCDNVNFFPQTTNIGSFYIWVGSGSDQCAVGTNYCLRTSRTTTAGNISVQFTPLDIYPFKSSFGLECVRKLSS